MIYAYWTASARDAEEGQNAYATPGGGTKIGSRMSDLPLRLFSDPDRPGLECLPFVDFGSAGDGTSFTVDAGLPIAPGGLDARRGVDRADPQPRLGREDRPARHAAGRQPDPGRRRRRHAGRR